MRAALPRALAWHRSLMLFATAMVGTGLVSSVGFFLDDRRLTGVPIWSKPLQFSLSFGMYAVTLAWLISRLQRPRLRRFAHRAGTVIALVTALEMVAIVGQVIRGRQSHFNTATPVDAAIYAGMGVLVVILFLATIAVGVALLRESPVGDRATTWAVRLGLGTSVLGMAVGFLMVVPRSSQNAAAGIRGSHSVGVPDGGPSLPLVGWSTTGGDLRVPHFIGLHALQALPLLALLLAVVPAAASLTARTRVRLTLVAAAGYLGLFVLSLWQALRGQPLTAPDTWTLAALAGLLIAVALAARVVLRTDRPSAGYAAGRTGAGVCY